ncbi:hypothetical protein [Chromohalobacter moromii]|uniref:Uncharacterized protein n=1 Tax=Chromohalobacter moromii TaxID=2860329 RepID=A0A9X2X306_9GAMM|nr:hypothetical protein [Chromohalobacter moromii]MCT8506119.1 hypothetical protein [Chromohalobacter moromii]
MDDVYKGIKKQIISMYRYIETGNQFLQKQEVHCDTTQFMRATMGHFLAIDLQSSCLEPLEESPFRSAIRDFVLGTTAAPEGIEVRITPFKDRKAILSQAIASTGTTRSIASGGDIYSSIRMYPFGITMYLRGSEDKTPALINLGDILTPGRNSFTFTPWLQVPPGYPEQIFRKDQLILVGDEAGLNGQFL